MFALRKKVLVIDDDPVIGSSFDRVLSESGYEVSTARDGAEALARVGSGDYDVVFTDIRMPGMDGIEVAERIRKTRPWIPVVIITGYGSPANVARAQAAGVAEILNKPLSPETIERSARTALRVIEGGAGKPRLELPAPAVPMEPAVATAPAVAAANQPVAILKATAMLLAAPLIGLAYVVALPFIGLGALAWMAARPLAQRLHAVVPFVRNAALFLAAPFVGLAYVIAFPFIGGGLLLLHAFKTLRKRSTKA